MYACELRFMYKNDEKKFLKIVIMQIYCNFAT